MRKVIIGTLCYDGRVSVDYVHALIGTLAAASEHQVKFFPLHVCYDALVQRARNDVIRMAVESGCDDLIFIDADQSWNPQDVFRLLDHAVNVVGAAVPKKNDIPDWNVKRLPAFVVDETTGLIAVESVGTGFLRLSSDALACVWALGVPYSDNGRSGRMVCDVRVIDGELCSEDTALCRTWASTGGTVWIDPEIAIAHTGPKTFTHDIRTRVYVGH